MSDGEYVCPKCKNTITVDYWDWTGGECSCGQEWFGMKIWTTNPNGLPQESMERLSCWLRG